MSTTRTPKMSRNTRTAIVVTIALLIAAAAAVIAVIATQGPPTQVGRDEATIPVTATSTHILQEGEPGSPVLVEFLDFECEACGAFYPVVEDLRERYEGQVTFAFRYFPLPGHGNAVNAAVAVEAAAQQGELEAMYSRMFETQIEWGERGNDSQAERFRGYAEEIGLDMGVYDATVADPATADRVQYDFDAGRDLGVTSTPTFFLDGELLELTSFADLEAALVDKVDP